MFGIIYSKQKQLQKNGDDKMDYLEINEDTFESIKHVDEFGKEFWYARELMHVLEYKKWENFHKVIKNAMITCENSGYQVKYCFPEVKKSIISGKGKKSCKRMEMIK